MFHTPNKYRLKNHPVLGSDETYGNNGVFLIPIETNILAQVIASDGLGWEHCSIIVIEDGNKETPTWEEMCKIKNLFWDEEDAVIQFHPPKSQYVNNHENCLHLWRKIGFDFPLPDTSMIGIKK